MNAEYSLHSQDHTPLDFFMEYIKDKFYGRKLAIVNELQVGIEQECTQIMKKIIIDVCGYIASRC